VGTELEEDLNPIYHSNIHAQNLTFIYFIFLHNSNNKTKLKITTEINEYLTAGRNKKPTGLI